MLYKKVLLVTLGLSLSFFTACSSGEDKPETTGTLEVKSVQIDARSYEGWVYFSFESGSEVEIDTENFSESLEWDIAFHRNDVRLNCGESGNGLGGAYTTDKTNLSEVFTAPESGYVVDGMKSIMTKFV